MEDGRKPQRGDEAELFEQFHAELERQIYRLVKTTPEVVEEACAIAWMRFVSHQPDRDRRWKGWLLTVARREAWRLDRERRATIPIAGPGEERGSPAVAEPADRRDPQAIRLDFVAAVDVLEQLPPRLRQIAFMRASGLHYSEIAEMHGLSRTRVNQLVARANHRIHEINGRVSREDLTPRGQRLYDLERDPPPWLLEALGRVPTSHDRRASAATRLLGWRRAALAIDDYRRLSGFQRG